jgi:serine/threonine protein kinase
VFPQIFGKYILERELASGGMAVVYLATLRGAGGFEKRLVVKQIRTELASDEAFVRRFVAEAKMTVELSHPNIVPVYELGVEQGVYFIAMELAHGVTLSELLKANGKLSPEEGAYLGVEICRALDYAHRRSGIVHRDVTPRNVLVDDEGAVRLIDFGIAAPVSVDGSPRERVYGSPGHMPTEQLKGGRLTPATDVFAVGALLTEAWTGEPPFRRASHLESEAALLVEREPLSRRVPALAALDDLMKRAISQDASERPQSAEDLARPLREFLRTADLGDIARRLGERVRRLRRESLTGEADAHDGFTPATPPMRAMTPSGSVPPPPVTPSTRPITQPVVTETFAFRDEVEEWIRSPSAPPPAMAAHAIEPESTVPLEPSRAEPSLARASRKWVGAIVAGAAVVVAGTLAARRPSTVNADGRTPPVMQRAAAPAPAALSSPRGSGVPSVSPGAGAPESATGAAVDHAAAVRTVPKSTGDLPGPARVPASNAAAEASSDPAGDESAKTSATFSITSDLPARVTIDGAAQGTTPLRGVKRAPGRHVIGLVSIELDERLTATVDAKSGATLTVHAEFTRPTPAIRLR